MVKKSLLKIIVVSFLIILCQANFEECSSSTSDLDKNPFGSSCRYYKKVIFFFLAGMEDKECQYSISKEIVYKADQRYSDPFLESIYNASIQNPQNSFYAKVARSPDQVSLSEEDRFISIMTGSQVNLLQREMFLTQISIQERNNDSILEQLSQLGDNKVWISPTLQKIMSLQSAEQAKDNQSQDYQQPNEETELKNLSDFQENLLKMDFDNIIFYDNTLSLIKSKYGPTSSKLQEGLRIYNQLINQSIESLDDNSILIIMGGGSNKQYQLDRSIFVSEDLEQQDSFSSFFFAYSKAGFADNKVIQEIREYNNIINTQNKKYSDPQYTVKMSELEQNREKYNHSKYIFNETSILGNVIDEINIASTLSSIIGLQTPTWNSGKNLLDIYPKSLNELYNHMIKDMYNTLITQGSFFLSLQKNNNFFSQSEEDAIKLKIKKISNKTLNIKQVLDDLTSQQNDNNKEDTNGEEQNKQDIIIEFINEISKLQLEISQKIDEKKEVSLFILLSSIFICLASALIAIRLLYHKFQEMIEQFPSKQLFILIEFWVILPLSLAGYYQFSYYNAEWMDLDIIQRCLMGSIIISFLETIIAGFKFSFKVYFILAILYFGIQNIIPEEVGTFGIAMHILLKIRFSIWDNVEIQKDEIPTQNFIKRILRQFLNMMIFIIQKIILSVIVILYCLNRLFLFNTTSPIIDSLFLLLVLRRKGNSTKNRTFIITQIGIQYAFNLFFDGEASSYAFNVYGVSLMFITLLSDIYRILQIQFSFNAYFAINVVLSSFSYLFVKLKGNQSIMNSLFCSLLYFSSSFLNIQVLQSEDISRILEIGQNMIIDSFKNIIHKIKQSKIIKNQNLGKKGQQHCQQNEQCRLDSIKKNNEEEGEGEREQEISENFDLRENKIKQDEIELFTSKKDLQENNQIEIEGQKEQKNMDSRNQNQDKKIKPSTEKENQEVQILHQVANIDNLDRLKKEIQENQINDDDNIHSQKSNSKNQAINDVSSESASLTSSELFQNTQSSQSNHFLLFSLVGTLQFVMLALASAYLFPEQFSLNSTKIAQQRLGLTFYSFVQTILAISYSIIQKKFSHSSNKFYQQITESEQFQIVHKCAQ